jgi:hypothetical protein
MTIPKDGIPVMGIDGYYYLARWYISPPASPYLESCWNESLYMIHLIDAV